MVRLGALLGAAVLAGMLVVELTMHPAASDRRIFAAALISAAVFGFVTTPIIGLISRRASRFRTSLALVSMSGLVVAVVLMAVATAGMYASDHDLRLTIVALGAGVLLVVAQQQVVADVLTRDIVRIDDTVERLASGDLEAETGVARRDEVGGAAASIDLLAGRLREAERLNGANEKARSELFANIGHDLQTPLASMRLAVEALEDGLAPDRDAYLASIASEIMHVSRLVNDLFLVAQLDAEALTLELEPIDLRELVDTTFEALRPVADSQSIALRAENDTSIVATVDAAELGRCLRNLVDNGIRHARSQVSVSLSRSAGPSGGMSVLSVADDGPGFGAVRERATERFVRGSESRQRDGAGAGLGLAICRGLVEAHGGTIHVGSSEMGGLVEVRLPDGAVGERGR